MGNEQSFAESMRLVVGQADARLIKVDGVAQKLSRLQVLSSYPMDLMCQLADVCKGNDACRQQAFVDFRLAVSQKLGLAAAAASLPTIYLDTKVNKVVTPDSFSLYIDTISKVNCFGSGEKLAVLNTRTGRQRKACRLGTERSRRTGRCRTSCSDKKPVRSRDTGRCRQSRRRKS